MKEMPILFSAPMVRAIIEGRKTQTRRVMKEQPTTLDHATDPARQVNDRLREILCKYGPPGTLIWVREEFSGPHYKSKSPPSEWSESDPIWYWADGNPGSGDWTRPKPSIHMPRWASRILLEVTGVRVEQLNEISEADAKAEGAMFHDGLGIGHSGWRHDYKDVHANARSSFARLWESINGPGSWEANPFVWVIEFKRIDNA